ncbi:hypothetical protein N8T08_010566 [Aspergillus melleus]|uniref:Uncharacterized protein n=1 Tax=Aspergillus melleus TaxID=138277 RepID=A0ACC3AR82_9EURO|nr:hypothetical protein N8T08_010566 [Aspergillus melleus]
MGQLRDLLVKAADITGIDSAAFEKYRRDATSIRRYIGDFPHPSLKRQLRALEILDYRLDDLEFSYISELKMDEYNCLQTGDGKFIKQVPDVTLWLCGADDRLDGRRRTTHY